MSRRSLATLLSLALVAGSGLPALAQTTTWNTAFTGTAVPNGETYVFVDGGSITPSGNPNGTLSIGPSLPSGTSSVLQFSYTGSGTSAAVLAGFGSVVVDGPGRVVFTNNSSPQSTPNGNLYLRSGTAVFASTNQAPSGTTVLQGGALQFSQGTGWQRELLLTSQGGLYDASLSSGNASQNSTVSGTGTWTLIGCGTASVASTNGIGIFYMNPTCNFTGTTTITGGKVFPSVDNAFGDSTQVGGSQANNKVILNGGSLFIRESADRSFVTAVEVGANGGYVDVYNNLTGQQGKMRFNAPISGTGQLTLLGQGSVFLTASNAFSGTLVTSTTGPNAGLQINNVNALRNAELNLVGSGVLAWGGGSGPYYFGGLSGTKSIDGFSFVTGINVGGNGRSTTYSGNVIDFQTLTKSGTGTLTFTGTSTLSQGTTITGGVLAVNGNLALGAATLGQSTPSSATVTLNGGTLKQTAAFNSARAFTIQSGGGGVDTSVVGSSAVVNLSGSFTGSGNLTLAANGDLTGSGTGNLALTGANTYTGTTTITSGMVSAASGLGNAANTLVLNGGGLIALGGTRTNSYATVIGLAQGTLKASAASDVLNQAAVMSGSGGLRASGNGTVNLQAANTFSGDTRTLSGTMNLAHANALQNSLLDMNGDDTGVVGFTAGTTTYNVAGLQGSRGITFNSGTLSVGSSNAFTTYSGPLGGTGRLVKVGNGDLTLTGTNSYAGGTVVSAGRLVGTTDGLQGTITNNAAVEFAQGTAGTYAGNLSGSGSVTKTGAGAVTLSGTLSHSGGTTVSAGNLIGTTSSLQGTITNNAAIEFAQATAGMYAGNLSGSGSVTKSGVGAVTLSGTLSHTGGTLVAGGTLIGTTSNLQAAITNNAVVEFAQATAGTYIGNVTGSGSVTKSGAGALTLSGTLSHTGGTLVSGGSLIGSAATIQGAVTNNAVVEFAQATAGTYSGAMTGSGSVTKSGAGALTLTAASSYAGTTNVQAGTLAVNANNIGVTGLIVLSSGATLAGSGTHGGAIAVNAGSTLSPGNSPGTFTAASGTWAGGGNYNWQLVDATGVAGTNWDLLNLTGGLNITATTGSPFNINLWTLSGTGPDVNGNATNFNANGNYSWRIATAAGGVTGFAANKFAVNTSATNGAAGFANSFGSGQFSVANTGNDVNVVFTPAIEFNVTSGTQTQTQQGAAANIGSAISVTKTGAGAVVLDGNNTYSAVTAVDAGSLIVTGTLTNSAVTVASGATLGGDGQIGQQATIASGGFLAPGAAPTGIGILELGSLSLGSSATTILSITGTTAGTGFDQVSILGGGSLAYGGVLDLSTSLIDGAPIGTSYKLFDFTGSPTGNFSSLTSLGGEFSGISWSGPVGGVWTSTEGTGGNFLTFTEGTGTLAVVPEPSTYAMALAGLGIAGIAVWRRRQQTVRA